MPSERRPYRRSAILDARVMALLEQSNRPLTAYEIAERSSAQGSPITAAQVYRVLDRLVNSNKVHRIELLAAYLPACGERCGFLICRRCRSVQRFSASALWEAADGLCRAAGFSPSRSIVEAAGFCADCAKREEADLKPAAKRKDEVMRTKGLLSLMTALAAMIAAAPADAAERRPGRLYDNTGKELGLITLTDAPKGVLLRIEARGLPPGWHGMHFHEKADCSDTAFKNAGGHVHSQKPIVHGFLVEDANDAGDLPNIHVDNDGNATVEIYSTLVSADGRGGRPALRDTDGSALVIHGNPDDYRTQPIGGAGERIACTVLPRAMR